ncbi:MAG: hypothetical protein Q4A67_05975 [Aerococcus sp.]|nr:hypothetical protein [Aerococcus sp.]
MTFRHQLVITYARWEEAMQDQQLVVRATFNLMNAIFQPSLLKNGTFHLEENEMCFNFASAAPAFLLFRLFRSVAYPFELYGGIGYGWLDIDNNIDQRTDDLATADRSKTTQSVMSGSAYQRAKDALALSKQKKAPAHLLYNGGWQEDALINMWFTQWEAIKHQQSSMQQALSFPYERQVPLYLKLGMQPLTNWPNQDLNKIEALKRQAIHLHGWSAHYPQIDYAYHKPTKWLALEGTVGEVGMVMNGFFKKGYATVLADMIQTTRQNIDYHLHHGQFAQERNLAAAIVWQLQREEAVLLPADDATNGQDAVEQGKPAE